MVYLWILIHKKQWDYVRLIDFVTTYYCLLTILSGLYQRILGNTFAFLAFLDANNVQVTIEIILLDKAIAVYHI